MALACAHTAGIEARQPLNGNRRRNQQRWDAGSARSGTGCQRSGQHRRRALAEAALSLFYLPGDQRGRGRHDETLCSRDRSRIGERGHQTFLWTPLSDTPADGVYVSHHKNPNQGDSYVLEDPEDRRSLRWYGNQHVRLRHAQVVVDFNAAEWGRPWPSLFVSAVRQAAFGSGQPEAATDARTSEAGRLLCRWLHWNRLSPAPRAQADRCPRAWSASKGTAADPLPA